MDKQLMRKKYDKEEMLKELKLNIYNLKKIIDLLEITTSRVEEKNILEKTKNDYKENIIKINKIKMIIIVLFVIPLLIKKILILNILIF